MKQSRQQAEPGAESAALQHYAGPADVESDDTLGVTFTATTAADGALLLGSSREFAGFDSLPSETGAACCCCCCCYC